MKWVYLTTAPDQLVAEMWLNLLRNEGVSAMIRPGDTMSNYLGVSTYPCRILVHEDEVGLARELLEGHLGSMDEVE